MVSHLGQRKISPLFPTQLPGVGHAYSANRMSHSSGSIFCYTVFRHGYPNDTSKIAPATGSTPSGTKIHSEPNALLPSLILFLAILSLGCDAVPRHKISPQTHPVYPRLLYLVHLLAENRIPGGDFWPRLALFAKNQSRYKLHLWGARLPVCRYRTQRLVPGHPV